MNRSFWTALILTAGVCALVMMALAFSNKRLSDQLAAGPQAADQGLRKQAPERGGTSKQTPTSPQSSEEKVGRASGEVARFIASLTTPPGSELEPLTFLDTEENRVTAAKRTKFYENLPDLLRAVEGLSVDELLAVAADIPVDEKDDMGYGSSEGVDTRTHLIMLAAEQDPMRVLQDEKLMKNIEKFWVLRCLARVDPDEALRLLPEVVPPEDIYFKKKRKQFGGMMLGSDGDRALDLFLEMRESDPDRKEGMQALNRGLELGFIPLPPNAIPELVAAMNNPDYGAIRNDIIKTTLDHHLAESGVAEAARQAGAIALTPEEIGLYLDSFSKELITTEPQATVEWMGDALTVDQQSRRIPEAVVEWANADVDDAAAWLGRQEPSPVRDQTIARFATEASELDAEGAAAWAREIQDEQLREETLLEVADK